jgi:hypothetical protein
MNNDWGDLIEEASKLIIGREKYQKTLGKLAAQIVQFHGAEALKGFAEDLSENTGYKVSPISLRNYGWVYLKTVDLHLPADIPFRIYQALAGVVDQAPYVKMIEEGYSASEVIRKIREDKGYTKNDKKIICPECGAQFSEEKK